MRVLEIVPSLDVGGAERMAALVATGLQGLGHEVALASLYDATSSWIEGELRAAGVPLHFLGKRAGLDLRVIPRLAKLVRAWRPDVVHTHLHTLKYAWPASRATRRPPRLVHTLHNVALHEIEASGRALQRVAFRAGVRPVAIGDAVAASVREVYGLEPAATIPNGIPVAAFAPPHGARDRVRAALGVPADARVAISVGRLNPQKNHALLLDAFANVDRAAWLLVAGDGDLRGELERRAGELGLTNHVRFLGNRRDVPALYAAADAMVLASSWEGNPLVVMEAMAAGLPVAATAVGCVPELVSAATGRLVPAGDAQALADAIGQVLAPAVGPGLGAAGLQVARERFDAATMARAYADLFDAIL